MPSSKQSRDNLGRFTITVASPVTFNPTAAIDKMKPITASVFK
jgi:hypothetical protein